VNKIVTKTRILHFISVDLVVTFLDRKPNEITMQIKSLGLLLMCGFIALLGACSVATAEGKDQGAATNSAMEATPEMLSQGGMEAGMETGDEASDPQLEASQVPEAVRTGFATKFPNMTPSSWEQKPYGYEAIFTQNGMVYEADFSGTGEWQKTEHEGELPPAIKSRIDQQYAGASFTQRQIEETPQGMFYQVELQHMNQTVKLYLDSQGNPAQNLNGG
jgi:hypothetical protein